MDINLILSTLNKLAFLFVFILIGFVLTRLKAIPESADGVLSKLENNLFTPCLILSTFISGFTFDVFKTSWKPILVCVLMLAVTVPLGILLGRLFSKKENERNAYIYGLCFSNFGFMGLAVVKTLFEETFALYSIFLLPLWIGVYGWGVPALLIPKSYADRSFKGTLKRMANPMLISLVVGAVIGISGLGGYITTTADGNRTVIMDIIETAGSCMSPLAMLLTGITIAKIKISKVVKNVGIYVASILRLVVIPIVIISVMMLLPIEKDTLRCALCSIAMPLGLSPVVVPAGYGEDTSMGAGMAIISHALSVITIPVIFAIFSSLTA